MHGVCPSLPYDNAHTRPTRRWVATRCPSCSTAAFRCAATASSRHEYLYTARCVRPAELGAGGRGASDRLAVPHRHSAGPRPRCTGQRAAAKALRPDRIPRHRNRCAAAGRVWQRRRARPGHAFAGALAKTRHPVDREVALRAPAKCFSPPPDDGRSQPAVLPAGAVFAASFLRAFGRAWRVHGRCRCANLFAARRGIGLPMQGTLRQAGRLDW